MLCIASNIALFIEVIREDVDLLVTNVFVKLVFDFCVGLGLF